MTQKELIALQYHAIFKYPLSKEELVRWSPGPKLKVTKRFKSKPQPYSAPSEKHTALQTNKKRIAAHAAQILSRVPTVLFVGITGSLAMNNTKPESDIDLMVITRKNSVWITRAFVFPLLLLNGLSLRRANNKNEQDKLCLNFWIDETLLSWTGPRNAYTAHEIAQVVPVVNKAGIYSSWLKENEWIVDYWPNAVPKNRKEKTTKRNDSFVIDVLLAFVNRVMYLFQKIYMQRKITRETVSVHHAYFHPYDWGGQVMKELQKKGLQEI